MKILNTFLLIIIFSSIMFGQQGNASPVIESRSSISFSETIDSIKSSAERKGWKVLIVHNLQESLKKNGQDVLPVSVIEICKPSYSGNILKNDEPRSLSLFMPCRVSVYEKGDGNVYVARMNVAGFMNSFDEKSASVMNNAAEEIESIISEIIK